MPDQERDTIGRYEIQGVLGHGAMGIVYKAYDPRLERYAAIKLMSTGAEPGGELMTRFFHEARSAAKLSHPNIISIYDLGEDGDLPFIAMEFLEGQDLKQIIEKRIFVPFEQKLEFVAQICEGLAFAHRHEVIHRDIKPGNVFITKEGALKILDFGLAHLSSSEMTRSGVILGSPYYMSPEQVKGQRDIDGRADLFSVGVLLYELLSYRRPFEGSSPTAVCFQIVSEPHPPLKENFPTCPRELGQIIDRALAKERDDRYQNGSEMASDLRQFQSQVELLKKPLARRIQTLERKLKEKVEKGEMSAKRAGLLRKPGQHDDDYGRMLFRYANLKHRWEGAAAPPEAVSEAEEILEDTQPRGTAVEAEATQEMDLGSTVVREQFPTVVQPAEVPAPAAREKAPFTGVRRRGLLLGVGLLVLLLLLLWWTLPGRAEGVLVLEVAPWAHVDSVTRIDSQAPVGIPPQLETPCRLSLPSGRYRIKVSSPHYPRPLEFEAAITSGEATLVRRKLPDFDPERELWTALEGKVSR